MLRLNQATLYRTGGILAGVAATKIGVGLLRTGNKGNKSYRYAPEIFGGLLSVMGLALSTERKYAAFADGIFSAGVTVVVSSTLGKVAAGAGGDASKWFWPIGKASYQPPAAQQPAGLPGF
ncbi:MAG: hypothetical protein PHI27_13815 [Eubacteriales bacterium]|nr:hypothetical protein [Eubacteriales bacterium]